MLDEVSKYVVNPYTWLALCVGVFVGVWWYRMNATYANLTLVIGVAAGVLFVALHPWVTSHPWQVRVLMAIATASILGVFVYFTLWIPPVSLGFAATTSSAEQPNGAVIGGITGMPAYKEVHVRIVNGSEFDVRDLDLVVRPDQPITAAGQITGSEGVSFVPNDLPVIDPQWVDSTGQRTAMSMVALATLRGFRIRCDVLPRRNHIELVMAAVTLNDAGAGVQANKLLRINFVSGQSVWFAHKDHTQAVSRAGGPWGKTSKLS